MRLPASLDREVWLRLRDLKEEKTVSHVTFAERFGREEGLKEAAHKSLRSVLEAKFGEEGVALASQLASEEKLDRIDQLIRAAVVALSSEEFRRGLSPTGS